MTEKQAQTIAEIFNAKMWRPHWGVYLVVIERQDNHIIVINDESISEYKNKNDYFENDPHSIIWFE